MDIRDLKFVDGSFDVAIDKGDSLRLAFPMITRQPEADTRAGTMDAMMTAKADVWASLAPSLTDAHAALLNTYYTRIPPKTSYRIATGKWTKSSGAFPETDTRPSQHLIVD